ncbi:MAG: hypothetical protein GY810_12400 [Aureispira sp.]|nr:hypothetical protein [Aureispira sp.]
MRNYIYILVLILLGSSGQLKATCTSGNCRDGFGHYTWPSGERYVGNWTKGNMEGHGVFYWKSGRKYIGAWAKNKMNGRGTMFYTDGRIKSGYWESNQFVRLHRDAYALSSENLKHGEAQLQQLLLDRPGMKKLVEKEDIVWYWVVHKFAGEDVKSPIFWQEHSTKDFFIPNDVTAAHSYPTKKQNGKVWVKQLGDIEEMWSGVIYELHNITNYKDFDQIEQDVKYNKCTKGEYIMRYASLEYKAAKATAQFYQTIWKPYCNTKNLTTNPQHWFAYIPDTFEAWIALFKDNTGYPWYPYAGYYDRLAKSTIERY